MYISYSSKLSQSFPVLGSWTGFQLPQTVNGWTNKIGRGSVPSCSRKVFSRGAYSRLSMCITRLRLGGVDPSAGPTETSSKRRRGFGSINVTYLECKGPCFVHRECDCRHGRQLFDLFPIPSCHSSEIVHLRYSKVRSVVLRVVLCLASSIGSFYFSRIRMGMLTSLCL